MSHEFNPFEYEGAEAFADALLLAHYEQRIEMARELSDATQANGTSGLDITTAYQAIDRFVDACMMPLVPMPGANPLATLVGRPQSISELDSTQFFHLAEALDTVMTHGKDEQKLTAAVIANDLVGTMPYTTQPGVKFGILDDVLGIDPRITSPALHLAEQYIFPEGTPAEHQAAADAIEHRSRTIVNA